MTLQREKELLTDISNVSILYDFVEEYLADVTAVSRNPMIRQMKHDIHLAIEEWYVNIVKHGFHGQSTGHVHVLLDYEQDWLRIQVTDDGPAFDPHTIAPPEKPKTLREARIGGLGFLFIRSFMDSTLYRREGNRNILTMMKRCE